VCSRKGKALGTLRGFFRFCMNRDWLAKNPVTRDLKPPLGANRAANKKPFTNDELQQIIHACDQLKPVSWSNGFSKGTWTGEDTKDFIWMLVYTGLRNSDVGLFHVSRLQGNEVFLRAKKNGGDGFTWIPDWLRNRLQSAPKNMGHDRLRLGFPIDSRPSPISGAGRSTRCLSLRANSKKHPPLTASGTPSPGSYCNEACLLPTSLTCWETTKTRCANNTHAGYPSVRHV
jgi:integrase